MDDGIKLGFFMIISKNFDTVQYKKHSLCVFVKTNRFDHRGLEKSGVESTLRGIVIIIVISIERIHTATKYRYTEPTSSITGSKEVLGKVGAARRHHHHQ